MDGPWPAASASTILAPVNAFLPSRFDANDNGNNTKAVSRNCRDHDSSAIAPFLSPLGTFTKRKVRNIFGNEKFQNSSSIDDDKKGKFEGEISSFGKRERKGSGSLEFYAPFIFIYARTAVRVLRYMRAQACILHVRITRNDRPGWLPLTVEHPRFYAFHRTAYLITWDNVGKGGGPSYVRAYVRACVSFTAADFSAFIERMRGGPLPTRDRSIRLGIAVENRLNPFLSPTVPCKYGLLHVDR